MLPPELCLFIHDNRHAASKESRAGEIGPENMPGNPGRRYFVQRNAGRERGIQKMLLMPKIIAGIPTKKRHRRTSSGTPCEGDLFDCVAAKAKAPPLKTISLRPMAQNKRAPWEATML